MHSNSPGGIQYLKNILRYCGIDRAVFFCNAAQVIRLITGPITLVLVLRYLTPEIQGYFYSFSGIVATQVFLEMGFSQNILQFASHEFAKLRLTPGAELEGDEEALSRLISLGRLAFGYYAVAALIFFIGIGVGGHVFFSLSPDHGVAWQGAWWIIALVAALSLAVNPAWSLLDGCNQVAIVARFRFWATLASFAATALALIGGSGIYVSAISSSATLLVSLGYLYFRWKPFFRQFLHRPQHGKVSWLREIWPFQWRIAVSWMSGYFIFDILNPVAFHFAGAATAGRFGMSMQLVRMISGFAMTWVSTKGPRFGMLVSSRMWGDLDALWKRSSLQGFVACVFGMTLFFATFPIAGVYFPQILRRFAPLDVTAWLAAAMTIQVVVVAMSMELRAHKREPFMGLSVLGAVVSLGFILPLTYLWGIYGEALGFALGAFTLFIPTVRMFLQKRMEYRRDADSQSALHALNPSLK